MIARSGAWMVGARFGRTFITLISMVALARLLTPTDFGIVAISSSIIVLVLSLLEGLIDVPVMRQDDLTTDMLRSLIWLSLLVVAIFGTILFFVAPLAERVMEFPRLSEALRLAIPVLLMNVHFIAGTAVLRRQLRFREAALLSIASAVAYSLPAVIMAFAGFGLWSILIAQNIGMFATAIAFSVRAGIGLALPERFTLAGVGMVGGSGALSRVLAWAWTSVDTLIVGLLLGPAATGLYARAYNINVQMKEPFAAVDQTLRQAFAGLKGRDGGLVEHSVMGLRLVTMLSGLVAAAVIVLREPIVLVLLGTQWLSAAPVVAILAASFPARIGRLYFDSLSASAGSMTNLILRQLFLLVVITLGLLIFARQGLQYVALVVSGAVYIAMLLPQARSETGSYGTLGKLLMAMLPGTALGAIIVGIDTMILRPAIDGWSFRFACQVVLLALGSVPVILLPDRWLPGRWSAARKRMLHRTPFAGKGGGS
ncbi:oligosaccharide flippase family protein [Sphingomonas hylomeconis]|uniref:Oligosaccharide flippase family protein n=1 Tax=Sphingomonas hylomeconis TaxID=1395958 RepID=A0ABV7SVJ2_9SPHN|nr:oligosaccharide flippase family protein [Sphingomonas hylomeconis]